MEVVVSCVKRTGTVSDLVPLCVSCVVYSVNDFVL